MSDNMNEIEQFRKEVRKMEKEVRKMKKKSRRDRKELGRVKETMGKLAKEFQMLKEELAAEEYAQAQRDCLEYLRQKAEYDRECWQTGKEEAKEEESHELRQQRRSALIKGVLVKPDFKKVSIEDLLEMVAFFKGLVNEGDEQAFFVQIWEVVQNVRCKALIQVVDFHEFDWVDYVEEAYVQQYCDFLVSLSKYFVERFLERVMDEEGYTSPYMGYMLTAVSEYNNKH